MPRPRIVVPLTEQFEAGFAIRVAETLTAQVREWVGPPCAREGQAVGVEGVVVQVVAGDVGALGRLV